MRTLHPFMAAKLGGRFELKTALETGLLPLVRAAADPAQTLRAYAALYLKEEVQAEGLVRDLAAFLMGFGSRADALAGPLAGALWESCVAGQVWRRFAFAGVKPPRGGQRNVFAPDRPAVPWGREASQDARA